MTLLDAPTAVPGGDEAQVLFQEARQRRRRRWIVSGITAAIVVVVCTVTLGFVFATHGGGTAKPAAPALPAGAGGRAVVSLSIRPVLCYAPPLSLAVGQSAARGPLPTCSAASQLTAATVGVDSSTGVATGDPPADARFSSYPSTPPNGGGADGTVLLPGAPGQGGTRFVLGPVGLPQRGIASARAVQENGQWIVDLTLSAAGSTQWDTLAQQQFHALVAVVLNGRVVSAPLIQPVQSAFSSFSGLLQVSGGFTEGQAKAMAAGL